MEIVCYGIGSVEKSRKSQYQFALMLILKDLFQVNIRQVTCPFFEKKTEAFFVKITGKVYAYDPVSTSIDLEILSYYEINTIDSNEVCYHIFKMNYFFN